MMHRTLLTSLLVAGLVQAAQPPLLLRQPTLSKTSIVFSHAGDLWRVAREGGEAVRLTNGAGNESDPLFSPDGTWVAFTGEYDGNVDVFVVKATGGEPKRLTFHPGTDKVVGWTPDGKSVIFSSARLSDNPRYSRLFTVPIDGVNATPVPLPMAFEGAFSPDGKRLAYVPLPRSFNAWKRYRGGTATPIWIADMADSKVEKVPRTDSNDFNPMWIGGKVYFLSDRAGAVTLFSYDTATKQVTQVLKHDGLDLKSASAGPDAIVYEQFGSLHLFDLASGKSRPVTVALNADMAAVRPRIEKVGTRIADAALSPTGARAVFEARGEIFTVPAEKGTIRNLTNTSGVAERDPAWSPDGKWIAYFSDASGEYELHLRDQLGKAETKVIRLEPSFYHAPTWSPDSKRIAFADKRGNLWCVDIEKGSPVKVDTSRRGTLQPAWSPDSRWLTYTKALPSQYSAVFLHNLDEGKTHQVTDGMSDAASPVFDKGGKHLFFTASTDIGPKVSGFDMMSYPHQPTRSVYVAVLKASDPSPLAPESDDEKEAKKPEGNGKPEGPKGADKKEAPTVQIDLEGFGQRILALPVPARAYLGLTPGKAGKLFIGEAVPNPGGNGQGGAAVHLFDLEKRKLEKVVEGIQGFSLSANGEKILYRQGPSWFITAASTPVKPGDGRLKTEDLEMRLDPRAEWEQMYREVWRIERDYFYDPGHHGLDLKKAAKTYRPFLDGLHARADLNYLFEEMLGELSVGHLYVRGGDTPEVRRVPGGLLGADLTREKGRHRIAKVFDGENWNPMLRAPLTQPGVNVKAGEYLLAVNGRDLTDRDDLDQALEGTAEKQVVLKVGPSPDGSDSREVTVVPVASEAGLRLYAWIEGNRRKVAEMTGGKVAYLWLPDTAQGGYTNFNRYFFSQLDKQAAVVDERFNGGGSAADYIIDYLKKPVYSYWAVRDGEDWRQPFGTLQGPKVMLVNEYAGSGGDYMPWLFRREKIGPLIGKRTWGGLVGIGGYPTLVDGGTVTAPHFAFYSPEGKFGIENEGVAPDLEVDLDPAAWRQGRDTQLERAVAEVTKALEANPPKAVKRPAYPRYH